MSVAFSASELINMAIGNEKRGIAFYDVMTRSTDSAAARRVFQYLGDMEKEHIQIFEGMLAEVSEYPTAETCTQEYADYLKALIDTAIFTDDLATSETANQVDSDRKALELAIGAEKDAILFYYTMKEILPQRAHAMVDKIIAEEKAHLRQLSELK
jgi:rubrerythrin